MPLGVLYTLSAYILWGLFPFYFKALDMIGAGEILAHRIVWSLGLVMLILVATRKLAWIKDALTDPKVLLIFTCSAFLVGANWGVYVYAIVTGKTLEASLGYFINPLMSVALGAVFLKERLTRPQMLAVALAFVGVLWITVKPGQTPWLGLALAVSFALYGLGRKVAPLGSLEGLSLETLILTPLAGLYLLYLAKTGTLVFGHTTQQIDWLLAAAGPITCIPLLLFASGVRRISYSTVGIIQYTSPTLVFFIGTCIFHEPLNSTMLIGFVFIWAAVALFTADSIIRMTRFKRTINMRAGQ